MNLKTLLRKLLGIPQPLISSERALQIAQEECNIHGIPIGDALVIEQLKNWLVWIDRNQKGSPMILVDQQNGSIIKFSKLPR
jgi:hypothetical protein